MEVKNHICFRIDKAHMLVDYLEKNDISFKRGEIISSLDICESDPHWKAILQCIKREKIHYESKTIFSRKELAEANWLAVYSKWRFGYPQPEDDFNYEDITYTRRNCCPRCSSGLVQVNPFRIKKSPQWGQRHFAELNWVGDELFLDSVAEEVLTEEKITGISFLKVYNKNASDIFPDIKQLCVDKILELGLQTDKSSVRGVTICPECGIPKILLSDIGMLSFCRDIFEDQPDVVKTGEIFGSDHYAARIILVRQKVYQTILRNKLDRGLVFEPIELV